MLFTSPIHFLAFWPPISAQIAMGRSKFHVELSICIHFVSEIL
ncbi:hypothetical protein SLEP1_g51224 [Rubroshorea leprosula]|uniref:Uncharacterized protein n=1 Tax=Rubroshorea leprosula TaxID=152421 RepID=A0AAV5M3Z8_9ROSI|nr:hypothetical protein SLEP1_g51224 [Rubroshorea leprosula]